MCNFAAAFCRTLAMHSPLDLPGTCSATAAQRSPGGSERVALSAASYAFWIGGGQAASSMEAMLFWVHLFSDEPERRRRPCVGALRGSASRTLT